MKTMLSHPVYHVVAGIAALTIFLMLSPHLAAEMPSEQPIFTFGVITDIQYCDCDPGGSRYYRVSLEKLAACVQDLNTRNLAFVIQLGDLIDRDFRSYDPVLALYQKLTVPRYHVLGNHDFLVKTEEQSHILKTLDLTSGYYDFTVHSWRFIVLNGNDLNFYARPESQEKYAEAEAMYQQFHKAGRPHAQIWNGGVSAQQMAWLQETLDHAAQSGEHVILFCHFPVFPDPNIHNLWNNREVTTLLESYDHVVAYLNGHNHAGNYGVQQGIHYLTLRAMVETAEQTAYAIIEVYHDRLKVLGKGREPERILPFK